MVMIPPLVIPELLLIRLLMTRLGKPFRNNIIATLKKPNDIMQADGLQPSTSGGG
jgi:hypothetical protein